MFATIVRVSVWRWRLRFQLFHLSLLHSSNFLFAHGKRQKLSTHFIFLLCYTFIIQRKAKSAESIYNTYFVVTFAMFYHCFSTVFSTFWCLCNSWFIHSLSRENGLSCRCSLLSLAYEAEKSETKVVEMFTIDFFGKCNYVLNYNKVKA